MKMIVGLGNPGAQYAENRHNVGFMFIEYLLHELKQKSLELHKETKFDAEVFKLRSEFILVRPQTFMNRSGNAVQKLAQFYKIPPEDIYVAYDDLDIPFGKFKVQQGGGPKIHNGITSINEALGKNTYWHIRFGVDNRDPENRMPGEAYVLQNFTADERQKMAQEKLFERASAIIDVL